MATFYSDQATKQLAGVTPHVSETGGANASLRWTLTTPAAGNGIGDVLVLGTLHKGDTLLGGQEFHGALGAGTFNIGTYAIGADGALGAAVSASCVAAGLAGATAVNALPEVDVTCAAAGGRYTATGDEYLCMTNVGTAFAASIACAGWLSVT